MQIKRGAGVTAELPLPLTSDLGSACPTQSQSKKTRPILLELVLEQLLGIRPPNFIGHAVVLIERLHTEELQDGAGYI